MEVELNKSLYPFHAGYVPLVRPLNQACPAMTGLVPQTLLDLAPILP